MGFLPDKYRKPDRACERFLREWCFVSDRLIAGGFIDPPEFSRIVRGAGLVLRDVPTESHGMCIEYLCAVGDDGVVCTIELLVEAVVGFYVVEREDVASIAYAYGTSANIEAFAKIVQEYGRRAREYRERLSLLSWDWRFPSGRVELPKHLRPTATAILTDTLPRTSRIQTIPDHETEVCIAH